MNKFGLTFGFLFSLPAFGMVTVHAPQKIDQARAQGFISSQSLMVKVKSLELFTKNFSRLGDLKPFLKNKQGTWGSLTLNMLPDSESAALILGDLSLDSNIIHAYFAPISKNANIETLTAPSVPETVAKPGDYESQQHYLAEAPLGVGARSAWEIAGGTGKNVKVIDIEVCWTEKHVDFTPPFYVGANPDCGSTDHGTAVWGEIAAKNDGTGVTGIAHGSDFGIFGFVEGDWDEVDEQYTTSINTAIAASMDQLQPGDVMVIEQQMVGPDLQKNTAVEFWPHIYEQLKLATEKGIICVEAAGNGNSNFDDGSYNGAFSLKIRDSGCIIVGAVGYDTFDRLSFSNYGARVDTAGYGMNVVTTGYGDLFNGGAETMYTKRFSGTSSATPIVAGVVAVVSSIAKENGRIISPKEMRKALRETGMPQGRATSKNRVGSFPVIKQLLRNLDLR